MQQIVECVPNFSDGRRPEVYNAIAEAIRRVPGTRVLSVSADPDHNRTVITFVGSPAGVEEAAFQAIRTAAQLINLDKHQGEHPRLGATDVCPFVPVKGVTLDDCVAIARRLGQRVGQELGIAVYLYEAAATRPERVKLAHIRKGEYELWKAEVATNPNRAPDFGPAVARPWGATVIGARPFLIAYNLYLSSDNVELANKIARAVRTVSGGLGNVQALGFLVEGQAQVSMNLTNFDKTPIYRVQELVRLEAARHGLSITKAELVGLTPQKALMDAAQWYLQLDDLQEEQILEYRLATPDEAESGLAGVVPHDFLAAVAGSTPTPGGGSVAALAGALGAALVEMVASLTVGRKKYAAVSEQAAAILDEAVQIRAQLTEAIVADAAAFDQVLAVYRDQTLDPAGKQAALETATIHASEVPLRVARACRDVAYLAESITQLGNSNAVTDAAAAGLMARAAVQTAALNVKINARGLQNPHLALAWQQEVASLEAEVEALAGSITAIAAERGGF